MKKMCVNLHWYGDDLEFGRFDYDKHKIGSTFYEKHELKYFLDSIYELIMNNKN